jgi:hypothetical protein
LAAEVARHALGEPLHFAVERLARLDALLLLRSEPVLGSHPSRCVVLVLVVPVSRNLPVMLAKLLVLPILGRRSGWDEKQNGESC